jgi:putative toxin-antitoxin system antitoxin component (TIGR02293 family)
LARRKKAGRFEQLESERLLRLGLVFEKSLDLFEGDRAAAGRWLNAPIKGLGGQTPLALTQTELGAREVEDLIGRLEHGVFS